MQPSLTMYPTLQAYPMQWPQEWPLCQEAKVSTCAHSLYTFFMCALHMIPSHSPKLCQRDGIKRRCLHYFPYTSHCSI